MVRRYIVPKVQGKYGILLLSNTCFVIVFESEMVAKNPAPPENPRLNLAYISPISGTSLEIPLPYDMLCAFRCTVFRDIPPWVSVKCRYLRHIFYAPALHIGKTVSFSLLSWVAIAVIAKIIFSDPLTLLSF